GPAGMFVAPASGGRGPRGGWARRRRRPAWGAGARLEPPKEIPDAPAVSVLVRSLPVTSPAYVSSLPGAGQGAMVMLPGSVVWVPALSVTATVKVNVPAVTGVPEIPAGGRGSRDRPGGSCPAGIDHLYGWTPPPAKKLVW